MAHGPAWEPDLEQVLREYWMEGHMVFRMAVSGLSFRGASRISRLRESEGVPVPTGATGRGNIVTSLGSCPGPAREGHPEKWLKSVSQGYHINTISRVPMCTCVCAVHTQRRRPRPPLPSHQQGCYYSGYQEEPKMNGARCNERHLVKQSQLPDNQSPCNSREDKRKPQGL